MKRTLLITTVLASSSAFSSVEIVSDTYQISGSIAVQDRSGRTFTVGATLPVDLVTNDPEWDATGTVGAVIRANDAQPKFHVSDGYSLEDIKGVTRCKFNVNGPARWNFNDKEAQGPLCFWRQKGKTFAFHLNKIEQIDLPSSSNNAAFLGAEKVIKGSMWQNYHGVVDAELSVRPYQGNIYTFEAPKLTVIRDKFGDELEMPNPKCDFGSGLEYLNALANSTVDVPSKVNCDVNLKAGTTTIGLEYNPENGMHEAPAYDNYNGDMIVRLTGVNSRQKALVLGETSLFYKTEKLPDGHEQPTAECDFGEGFVMLSTLKGAVVKSNHPVTCKFGGRGNIHTVVLR